MTPLEYAFVGGLSIACAMVISPVVTFLSLRYSIRLVLNIGTILETLSLITTSFATQSWHLFLSQGVCFGIGMGFLFIGSVGVVSQWFDRKRSLVNGITSSGSGTGGLIYSLAVGSMIPRLGFPWAMRILGILCFVVNLICGNLLRQRHRPSTTRKQLLHFSLFHEPAYLVFLIWGVLSAFGYVTLLFSLSSYITAVGYSQHEGSIGSALLNMGMALGRPAVGFLSDYLGRVNVAGGATFLAGLFCLVIWIFANSLGVIYLFSVFGGLVAGTLWAAAPPLAVEAVGLSRLPDALGIFWLAISPPCAVAEVIALQLRNDETDNMPYIRVQLYNGFMYIGAALSLILFQLLLYRRTRTERKTVVESERAAEQAN